MNGNLVALLLFRRLLAYGMLDGADGRHCGYPRYQLKIAIAMASAAEHETFNILKSKGLPEWAHAELAKQVT